MTTGGGQLLLWGLQRRQRVHRIPGRSVHRGSLAPCLDLHPARQEPGQVPHEHRVVRRQSPDLAQCLNSRARWAIRHRTSWFRCLRSVLGSTIREKSSARSVCAAALLPLAASGLSRSRARAACGCLLMDDAVRPGDRRSSLTSLVVPRQVQWQAIDVCADTRIGSSGRPGHISVRQIDLICTPQLEAVKPSSAGQIGGYRTILPPPWSRSVAAKVCVGDAGQIGDLVLAVIRDRWSRPR